MGLREVRKQGEVNIMEAWELAQHLRSQEGIEETIWDGNEHLELDETRKPLISFWFTMEKDGKREDRLYEYKFVEHMGKCMWTRMMDEKEKR